jgi:cytidine deaminase
MAPIDWDALVAAATRARMQAYVPYSRFQVGAALLDESGGIHVGCNVENASYGLTVCGERVALFGAIAAGVHSFRALVVVTDASPPAMPCGACRQVLNEFAPGLPIVAANTAGARVDTSLAELLPRSFGPSSLP